MFQRSHCSQKLSHSDSKVRWDTISAHWVTELNKKVLEWSVVWLNRKNEWRISWYHLFGKKKPCHTIETWCADRSESNSIRTVCNVTDDRMYLIFRSEFDFEFFRTDILDLTFGVMDEKKDPSDEEKTGHYGRSVQSNARRWLIRWGCCSMSLSMSILVRWSESWLCFRWTFCRVVCANDRAGRKINSCVLNLYLSASIHFSTKETDFSQTRRWCIDSDRWGQHIITLFSQRS